MAVTLTINGTGYSFPNTGDGNWGDNVTNWATAVSNSLLQKTGGTFTLTAEVDFGATYGLKTAYYKSQAATVASAGIIRLAKTETIAWRNNGGGGNNTLSTDTSDNLTYNGVAIASSSGVIPVASGGTGLTSYTIGDMIYASATTTLAKLGIGAANRVQVSTGTAPSWALIVNANIDAAAAVAYSKLALTGSIVNADINASAAIAYSKLALTGSIVNADINASAAIAYSKLALTDSILNADINSAAAISFSKLATLTSGNILVGSVGNVATSVAMSGDATIIASGAITIANSAITNAKVSASAAIDFSKLATLTSANILVGNVSNVAASVAMSGDITITNAGVTAIGSNKVTLAQMAQMATASFLGRNTASTGNVEVLSATTATAILNAMVGDSGSGGTKGLVPAPASGDAAASKFLSAGGTWAATPAAPTGPYDIQNLGIACSVGSSALTIALKQSDGSSDPSSGASAVKIGMRSSTATSGAYNIRSSTAATSVVVPSTATLGTASGVASYLYVYAIDNSGTVELAVSSSQWDDGSIVSTTTIAAASNSVFVMYSTTGRSNVPCRLIARLYQSQATAGTWASAPTVVSLAPVDKSKQLVVGAAQTSAGSTTSTTFADPTNQPTITFTAVKTGKYKISLSGQFSNATGSTFVARLNASSGSPVSIFSQEAAQSTGVNISIPFTVYRIDFLTLGTSYTYTLQGKTDAGTLNFNQSLISNGVAIVAEQID